MPLSAEDLVEIDALLGAAPSATALLGTLRQRFPRVTVTRCDAADVELEVPFRAGPHAVLYLLDSANHCWRLTEDFASASGLVVVPRG
jgi:hypothetical protein